MRGPLCGAFRIDADGRKLEARLPGRQGRGGFAYLARHRARPAAPAERARAASPGPAPAQAGASLSILLSKVRSAIAPARLEGRSDLGLLLPEHSQVDVEHALESVHSAESAVAAGEWRRAWAPSLAAFLVTERRLL